MSSRRGLAAAILLVVALALLAGCNGPASTQEVVCHGCVDAVEDVTGGSETTGVEESATHVHLQESGDARFIARMTLGDRDGINGTTASRVVERLRAIERDRDRSRAAFERLDLDARVDGDAVVVTYRVERMAERHFGILVVDRFFRDDGEARSDEIDRAPFRIGTDRLVVHGPDGTTPLVTVSGAAARGDRLVWTGDEVSTRTYLVFGDSGSRVRGRAAVAVTVFGWAGPQAFDSSFVPTLVLATLAIAFAYSYPRRVEDGWRPGDDWLFKILVPGAFALPIGVVLLWLVPSLGLTVAILLSAVAGIWLMARSVRSRSGMDNPGTRAEAGGQLATVTARSQPPTVRRSIGQRIADGEFFERDDVFAVTASVATVAAVTAVVAADFRSTYAESVRFAAAVPPFVAFPALGYLATDRERTAHRAVAVVAAAAGPWLFQFALTVEGGDLLSGLTAMLLLPIGYHVGAVVLFYVVLWLSTQ